MKSAPVSRETPPQPAVVKRKLRELAVSRSASKRAAATRKRMALARETVS
jgi:hypothetical protein